MTARPARVSLYAHEPKFEPRFVSCSRIARMSAAGTPVFPSAYCASETASGNGIPPPPPRSWKSSLRSSAAVFCCCSRSCWYASSCPLVTASISSFAASFFSISCFCNSCTCFISASVSFFSSNELTCSAVSILISSSACSEFLSDSFTDR